MAIQMIIVGTIVLSALTVAIVHVVNFFRLPKSKCHGCSGCKLEELKAIAKR